MNIVERIGKGAFKTIDEIGYAFALLAESCYWAAVGRRLRQPVRIPSVFAQMMRIGIQAIPIATLLSVTIGVMLAIQSLYSLSLFRAESFAHVGIAFAVVREFGPLIIGVLVAGRSGSALAARLSTMTINQEIDALRVMGINPVRYLVAPALFAMIVMVPALSMWSILISLAAAGFYVSAALDTSLLSYFSNTIEILRPHDLTHGLGKSVIFGALIALIGVVNGSLVTGGAEGVGRATTRSVVQAITAIVVTDMIFAFITTR